MPRIIKSATTSKKPAGDDERVFVPPSKATSIQPLDEKDRALAEKFLQQDAEKKEEEKREQKQKNVAKNKFLRKTKPILNQVDHGKLYKRIKKQNPETLEKYKRDVEPLDRHKQSLFQLKSKQKNKEENIRKARWADTDRAKAEINLVETEIVRAAVPNKATGIELDDDDVVTSTALLTQDDLMSAVDINTQKKVFNLVLKQQAPYSVQYTQSGRYLLLGGQRGHISSIRWRDFEMKSEVYVNETVRAIQWMMDDSMYAVAQSPMTYIYNEKGVEIHCCKDFYKVDYLTYLPFHFLLVGATSESKIIFKDVSLGENVATLQMPTTTCMTQNPSNALILLGHSNGSLSMCTPRDPPNKPVVSMFAHKGPLKTIAVDPSGHYITTAGIEGTVKVWDVRTYGCVGSIGGMDGLSTMQISQKGMLAVGIRNQVRVYRHSTDIGNLYMKHNVTGTVRSVSFCPYEDTLAIGHAHGVSSILIPGSGEPSFDSRTPNPYSTDQFIKDWNVRSLLDKLPYDSICLDDGIIGTSGRRATDYNYDPQVKVTDELKQELSAIGVKQSGKKRKVSSRDQLREELAQRDQQTKEEVGGDWWDRSEDALERFGTLKRRKLKHELQKRKDVKDTLDESEAQDATEDMQDKVETVGGSLRSLLEDNDDQVIRVSKGKVVEDASEEEDDEEDGGSDHDDEEDDEVDNQDESSDEEQQDSVEEPDSIVDPFAGFD